MTAECNRFLGFSRQRVSVGGFFISTPPPKQKFHFRNKVALSLQKRKRAVLPDI